VRRQRFSLHEPPSTWRLAEIPHIRLTAELPRVRARLIARDQISPALVSSSPRAKRVSRQLFLKLIVRHAAAKPGKGGELAYERISRAC